MGKMTHNLTSVQNIPTVTNTTDNITLREKQIKKNRESSYTDKWGSKALGQRPLGSD